MYQLQTFICIVIDTHYLGSLVFNLNKLLMINTLMNGILFGNHMSEMLQHPAATQLTKM